MLRSQLPFRFCAPPSRATVGFPVIINTGSLFPVVCLPSSWYYYSVKHQHQHQTTSFSSSLVVARRFFSSTVILYETPRAPSKNVQTTTTTILAKSSITQALQDAVKPILEATTIADNTITTNAYQLLVDGCKKIAEAPTVDETKRSLFGSTPVSPATPDLLGIALHYWWKTVSTLGDRVPVYISLLSHVLQKLSGFKIGGQMSEPIAAALLDTIKGVATSFLPQMTIRELSENFGEDLLELGKVLRAKENPEERIRQAADDCYLKPSVWVTEELQLSSDSQRYDIQASRVFIIGGSSGSGKTVFALQAAKMCGRSKTLQHPEKQSPNVVLYLTPSDILYCQRDITALTCGDSRKRDDFVHQAILDAVEALLTGRLQEEAKSSVNSLKADTVSAVDDYKVVIIIDEAGASRDLVRGLCSRVKEIGAALHKQFFDKRISVPAVTNAMSQASVTNTVKPFDSSCRIRFIVAGAGLGLKDSGVADGTSSTSFRSILLDNMPVSFSQILKTSFDDAAKARREVKLLERLCSEATPSSVVPALSHAELIARSLVKNARCAALLIQYFRKEWLFKRYNTSKPADTPEGRFMPTFPQFDGVYDQVLTGALPVVVRRYIELNGLKYFEKPENLLLIALAACVFRLPSLPASLGDSLLKRHDDRTSNVFESLCVKSGVLGDLSLNSDAKLSTSEKACYLNTPDGRLAPKSGRFLFSEAHVAMVHILFDLPRRPATSDGFEYAVGDFCTLVAACAPFYQKMAATLKLRPVKIDDVVNSHWMDLKRALVFEGLQSSDDDTFNVFYLRSQQNLAKKMTDERMKPRLDLLNDNEYCGLVKKGQTVVVMLSAVQEPSADLVVLGPNKLVLIQCKSFSTTTSEVNFEEELAKMGLKNYGDELPKHSQVRYLKKLVDLCRVKNDDEVAIEAFVMIEAATKEVYDEWKKPILLSGTKIPGSLKTGSKNKWTMVPQHWTARQFCFNVEDTKLSSSTKNLFFPSSRRVPILENNNRKTLSPELVSAVRSNTSQHKK
jgi:hypothetical protein